jgi:hypothetical protein
MRGELFVAASQRGAIALVTELDAQGFLSAGLRYAPYFNAASKIGTPKRCWRGHPQAKATRSDRVSQTRCPAKATVSRKKREHRQVVPDCYAFVQSRCLSLRPLLPSRESPLGELGR